MEVDVGLQDDGTGEPHACRNNEAAAAFLSKVVDGLGKGFGVELDTIAHSIIVLDADLTVRDGGCTDLRHLKGQVLLEDEVGVLTVCTAGSAALEDCRGAHGGT